MSVSLCLCLYLCLCLCLCLHTALASLPPLGRSPAPLGSVRASEEPTALTQKVGGIYGGAGDKPHLGGWTDFDPVRRKPLCVSLSLSLSLSFLSLPLHY